MQPQKMWPCQETLKELVHQEKGKAGGKDLNLVNPCLERR